MKNCILEIKNIYPKLRILHTDFSEFFIEEVKWIKSCNYIKEDLYLQANRTGRKCEKKQGPQRIPKNSTARKAIFQLMQTYNEKLTRENLVDNEDINIYALQMAQTITVDKYCHIIIDKSNNLTKVQVDFINELYNEKSYSSMMFLVDIDAPHHTNSWIVKGKRVNAKPLGEKAKVIYLKIIIKHNKHLKKIIKITVVKI